MDHMVGQCSSSTRNNIKISVLEWIRSTFILNKTVTVIPRGGWITNENGFMVNTDVEHDGGRVVTDGTWDHGNSGEESISLTSDGTVADRRGRREGHHFSVGRVKQARDISA